MINQMKATVAAVALATLSASMPVLAHEVTYKGTAIALKTVKYAQPNGPAREVQELELTVVDAKTKKPVARVFTITANTRVFRDGKAIKASQAVVAKGDEIAVIVDHDKPGDEAIEVWLAARK